MPAVNVKEWTDALVDPASRSTIEADWLPEFLRRQRWFAGKARGLASARFATVAQGGRLPAKLALTIVEVKYDDDGIDHYFLPVVAVGVQQAGDSADDPRWALAKLEGREGPAVLLDAIADDDACRALLGLIAEGGSVDGADSTVRGIATDAMDALRGPIGEDLEVHRSRAEQSNSAVIFGQQLILKIFRRPEPGINPDFEIGRFLTDRTDFTRIPPTAGALELARSGEEGMTLAILQGLVANEGSGWDLALAELAEFYERAGRAPAPPAPTVGTALELDGREPPPELRATAADSLESAATLGRRTAEMHLALASDPNDPAFTPVPMTHEDLQRLAEEAGAQVRSALASLESGFARLNPAAAAMARRVIDGGPRLLARIERLAGVVSASARTRVHGDYHLGQVLGVEGGDYVILDFEGEPARPLAARKRKESPIKDVVGMIRSYDYAAHAALFKVAENDPDRFEALLPWAAAWSTWASAAFLAAYRQAIAAGPHAILPPDPRAASALFEAYTLEKSTYELAYELNNRPDWVRIPLSGIANLIGEPARPRP